MSGARIVMVIAALVVSTAWVAGAAASQQGAYEPAGAAAGPNLIRNGGADAGPGVMNASLVSASMPGWTRTAGFTAVKYAAGGGFPDATIGGPIKGKANFFAGGPNVATSSATQVVNVTRFKAPIDAGQRVATLDAFLGGYAGHGDSMSVTATFLSETGKKLGVLKVGPVTAAERQEVTALIEKSASKPVPKKTRSIQVKLAAKRVVASYNDAYADNVSLTLAAP
jgi:hypothetical protein